MARGEARMLGTARDGARTGVMRCELALGSRTSRLLEDWSERLGLESSVERVGESARVE